MFKVGELIVGLESSDRRYIVTNQKSGFVGKVLISKPNDMKVEVIHSDTRKDCIGYRCWVEPKYFESLRSNVNTINRMRRSEE